MKSLKIKLRQFLGLKTTKQLIRFLITGGIATIISSSVFFICLHIFDLHYILANFIAFITGVLFGYNCNRLWSFSGPHHKSSHLFEYLAVYLTSLLISTIILKISIDFFGIIPEIAFIFSLCVTTCTNFLGIKFLVFKK
jgi:putative flippase GtrA